MPKLILEFNLPEEQYEADIANKAMDLRCLVNDLENILRSASKHETIFGRKATKTEIKFSSELRDWLHRKLQDKNIQD